MEIGVTTIFTYEDLSSVRLRQRPPCKGGTLELGQFRVLCSQETISEDVAGAQSPNEEFRSLGGWQGAVPTAGWKGMREGRNFF